MDPGLTGQGWIALVGGIAGVLVLAGLLWANRRAYGCSCGHGLFAHTRSADGSWGACTQRDLLPGTGIHDCLCVRYDGGGV